ncbi:MAG TPA: FKBP-type peptidyl-prolyl cis-trans isomerase [Chryseosolibacter sp.]
MNMVVRSILSAVAIFSACLLAGCGKDNDVFDEAIQFEKEVAAIDDYLETNTIPHIKDPSGVRIVVKTLGTKLPAQAGSQININYKGTIFATGEVFEESTATGFVEDYIRGWQIGIRKLPVGSEATLYIPSFHAYGNNTVKTIKPNSTLIFDIKINSTTQTTVYNNRFTSDTTALNTYIGNKQLDVVKDPTGVRYQKLVQGSGNTPSWFTPVKIKYSIMLLSNDQKVIGTYEREPVEGFNSLVIDYIQGLQVALQHMKVGSKYRVFIPSGLAFGPENGIDSSGVIIIPGNSNLIVDLELIEAN